jgi:diacylglycerol kinase (ATP)
VHLAATGGAIALGIYFGLAVAEWLWIVLAVGLVWFAEAVNTAIEQLGNAITLDRNPQIGTAKDVAAAAVLFASATALAIGLLIFGPHVLKAFG